MKLSIKIYRVGFEKWQLAVHTKGQRRRPQVTGSYHTAERIRDEWMAMAAKGVDLIAHIDAERAKTPEPVRDYPKLRDAIPAWIDTCVKLNSIRGGTPRGYHSTCRTWLYPALGDKRIHQITHKMLADLIEHVRLQGRKTSTVKMFVNPLKTYFEKQIKDGVVKTNPTVGLNLGSDPEPTEQKPIFTLAEIHHVLAVAKASFLRWYAFLCCGLLGGMRWGETMALKKSDVDFERGVIRVMRSFEPKGVQIVPTKTKKGRREVPMNPELAAALKAHIEQIGIEGSYKEWNAEQREWVFANSVGKLSQRSNFYELCWRPLLAKAGLKYRRYHISRNSLIESLLSKGADPRYVQAIVGHANVFMTVEGYGQFDRANYKGPDVNVLTR